MAMSVALQPERMRMMYSIGDKVVYPMHGAGIIESIEEQEILGESRQYYVLRFALGGMKVMVPVMKVSDVGLRLIIEEEVCAKVLEHLGVELGAANENWNRRYRENLDKMKTGDIYEVAEVVRSLSLREKSKGLSTGERKMLNNAKQILISELVLSSGKEEDEVRKMVEKVV